MGFSFSSCCGRRDKQSKRKAGYQRVDSEESEPPHEPRKTWLEKGTDIVAATRTGKIPSQGQIDGLIRAVLRSDVLAGGKELSREGGEVVGRVKELLEASLVFGLEKNYDDKLQDCVHNISQFDYVPMSVNIDIPQDTINTLNSQLPTQDQLTQDLSTLLASIKTLSFLFISSSTLHILLTNSILLLRQVVGGIAGEVKSFAEGVEERAEALVKGVGMIEDAAREVEESARIDNIDEALANANLDEDGMREKVKGVVEEVIAKSTEVEVDTTQPEKDEKMKGKSSETFARYSDVLLTIKQFLIQGTANQAYLDSIHTIIKIVQKYVDNLSSLPSPTNGSAYAKAEVTVEAPERTRTKQFLSDAQEVLERLAGGKKLDPLIDSFKEAFLGEGQTASDFSTSEIVTEWKEYLSRLQEFILDIGHHPQTVAPADDDVNTTSYLSNPAPKEELLTLVQRGRHLLNRSQSQSPSALSPSLRKFWNLLEEFIHALENDKSTTKLLSSFSRLANAVQKYLTSTFEGAPSSSDAATQGNSNNWLLRLSSKITHSIWKDLTKYFIPRLINGFAKAVWVASWAGDGMPLPLPRVEVKSGEIEIAIDFRTLKVKYAIDEEEDTSSNHSSWCAGCTDCFRSRIADEEFVHINAADIPPDPTSLETPSMTTSSAYEWIMPSSIHVQRWTDTKIDMTSSSALDAVIQTETTPLLASMAVEQDPNKTKTTEHTSIQLKNIFFPSSSASANKQRTLSLNGILYYLHFKHIVFYTDEGAVDVDIGVRPDLATGIELAIDLDFDSDSFSLNEASGSNQDPGDEYGRPFKVSSIDLKLPSTLRLSPDILHSRHHIINSVLIEPIIKLGIVQRFLRSTVEEQLEGLIHQGLDGVANWVGRIAGKVQKKKKTAAATGAEDHDAKHSVHHWWSVVVDEFDELFKSKDQPKETEDNGPQTVYDTDVTMRGVKVRITEAPENDALVTHPPLNEDAAASTTIAVGVVPQLFPKHAVPSSQSAHPFAHDLAAGVVNGVEDAIDGLTGAINGAVTHAGDLVGGLNKTGGQVQEDYTRKKKEEEAKGDGGWRSDAFDV